MQFSKWTMGVGMLLGTLLPISAEAQVVKNDKLLSFEDPQIPVFISGTDSRLEISDEHYKDGLHSLSWTFNPGAVLSIKKDLKFEKKDPTGKDTYLSAFIVWVYNEQAQDKKIEFEFLKDGKKCTSFPFGINFTGWRAAWVCYERDMVGTPRGPISAWSLSWTAPPAGPKTMWKCRMRKINPLAHNAYFSVPSSTCW